MIEAGVRAGMADYDYRSPAPKGSQGLLHNGGLQSGYVESFLSGFAWRVYGGFTGGLFGFIEGLIEGL